MSEQNRHDSVTGGLASEFVLSAISLCGVFIYHNWYTVAHIHIHVCLDTCICTYALYKSICICDYCGNFKNLKLNLISKNKRK